MSCYTTNSRYIKYSEADINPGVNNRSDVIDQIIRHNYEVIRIIYIIKTTLKYVFPTNKHFVILGYNLLK